MPAQKDPQQAEPGTDIQIAHQTPPEIAVQEVAMRTAAEAFGDDQRAVTLLVGRRLGRREVFTSLVKLLTVTDLEDLSRIKESKEYKGFQCRSDSGELLTVSDWPDYCRMVEGRSHQLVDNDLLNYKTLGADGFNALRALGIGPARMRELRRASLPEADNAALIELAKAGDKDAVLDLAEELIARHAEEKAEAAKALDDARGDIEAKDTRANQREQHIEQLEKTVSKLKREGAKATPDDVAALLREKANAAAFQVRAEISARGVGISSLRERVQALRAHAADQGDESTHDLFAAGLFGELLNELRALRDEFGLPIVGDYGDPTWSTAA